MHKSTATSSDFLRAKSAYDKRAMDYIMDSFKKCEASHCQMLVRKAGELLCEKHLLEFIEDMDRRNQYE